MQHSLQDLETGVGTLHAARTGEEVTTLGSMFPHGSLKGQDEKEATNGHDEVPKTHMSQATKEPLDT